MSDELLADDELGDELGAQVRFAVVPEWVLDAEVSDRAVRLYGVLARYADAHGRAWPGRKTLATRLRCSTDSIDRALEQLVAIGAVTKRGRVTENGDQTSNLYVVRVTPHRPALEVATFKGAENTPELSTGVAAPMPRGGRSGAATPAAPVRPERKPSELEPPNPQARRATGCPMHKRRAARNCRGCGTTPRQLAEAERRARPQWCGSCDETTRQHFDADTQTASRCPACHPLADHKPKASRTLPLPIPTESDHS